jgi:hypothetical protein
MDEHVQVLPYVLEYTKVSKINEANVRLRQNQ